MTTYKEFRLGGGRSPFGGITAILFLGLIFVGLYFIAKGIFILLTWTAPFLLIGSLLIDHTVSLDYVKFVIKLLKENPIMGLITILLSVVGFPVLFGYLFFKSILRRKLKNLDSFNKSRSSTTYTEYEEIEEDESFLELPELKKEMKTDSDYEQLFD